MDEFLKLSWRTKQISDLEPQRVFITEEVISKSLIYKSFHDKRLFKINKRKQIFDDSIYFPGGNFGINTTIKSLLDEWSQEQCLKALKLLHNGKDPSSFTTSEQFFINVFNKLKPKIIQENAKYETHVLNEWNQKDKAKLLRIKPAIILFGKQCWEMRWKNLGLYPRFYNEKCSFNMKFNENENIIDFTCTHNVLEMGTLARFSHPDLRSPCRLQKANLPNLEDNHHFNSKLPVSRDENIMNLLQQFEVDIVISFSALKCITDSSDLKNKWLIPIVVKKIKIQRENEPERSKKIVFLDKRCSYTETSNVDFAHLSFKRLIRTNFCQFEAFKYDKQETSVSTSEETRNKSSTVNENADEAFREKNCNKIHHNATYRIWNIKKTDCQNNLMKNKSKSLEINVLVRSKLDACECNENNTLQPVILYPKLEMQLNFGANIPSKSELAREWTSLFFTPYSNLYRVRISPLTNEVICVERCTIQKVVTEAQTHYNYKPHLGLGILQKVFEKLQMLEPGNYLLQHLPKHEAFVAVLKECQESGGDRFDLHSEQEKIVTDSLPKDWLPIDVNFVLPSFDIARRMPGMFSPRKKFNKVKKKKKGKKLKSTKGKAKKSKQ